MENKKVIAGLIKGRHEMPVETYIFDEINNMFDYNGIERHIVDWIVENVGICHKDGIGINQADYSDVECWSGKRPLEVYVTGLTSVTAALIKVCALNGVALTLYHFNVATGSYEPQEIFR